MEKINIGMQKMIFFLIKTYQYLIRPYLKPSCRFYPSCSDYSMMAFKEFGLINGFFYTISRLIRCQPWSLGGYDPIISKNKEKPHGH